MKEKHENDMKKELKKLQLHRNYFRQLIKDQELKDPKKLDQLQEVCYEIEEQMENVRELEKEYKQKKLNKQVYMDNNEVESKFVEHSDSDYSKGPSASDSDSSPRREDSQDRLEKPSLQQAALPIT